VVTIVLNFVSKEIIQPGTCLVYIWNIAVRCV